MEDVTNKIQVPKTGFLEAAPGVKSSARLFSFLLLLFFFVINSLYIGLGGDITVEWITFDFMLLVGVFAPRQLHKMQEVRQLIEQHKTKS